MGQDADAAQVLRPGVPPGKTRGELGRREEREGGPDQLARHGLGQGVQGRRCDEQRVGGLRGLRVERMVDPPERVRCQGAVVGGEGVELGEPDVVGEHDAGPLPGEPEGAGVELRVADGVHQGVVAPPGRLHSLQVLHGVHRDAGGGPGRGRQRFEASLEGVDEGVHLTVGGEGLEQTVAVGRHARSLRGQRRDEGHPELAPPS